MTDYTDADRVGIRAQAASAGRLLSATWPLKTFVAVNPLGGLQERPFEAAAELAGELLRTSGHLPLAWFRAEHARGRITDADLAAAVRRRVPDLDALPPVTGDRRRVGPVEILQADLVHAPEPKAAPAPPRGAAEWCDVLLGTSIAPVIDEQVAKWCAAFCSADQAGWSMPGRHRGLYPAWRALVGADPAVDRLELRRARMCALPVRAEDAILDALATLQVPDRERRAELRAQLARLPGWTSHLLWRADHPDQAPYPADLVDLLAVRLTYEAELTRRAADALPQGMADLRAMVERRLDTADRPAAIDTDRTGRARAVAAVVGAAPDELDGIARVLDRLPAADRGWVWLDAYEWHYRDRLLTRLSRPALPAEDGHPAVQAVFCIDARSEGLRRHLEARGPYRTFGFPGFYQLAMRYRSLAAPRSARLFPVPLTPRATIVEQPAAGRDSDAADAVLAARHAGAWNEAFHGAKDDVAASFAFAEAAGWVAGPMAAAKTLVPTRFARARARLARRLSPRATDLVVAATPDAPATGYDLDEQVTWAQFALRSLGLVEGFARIVLLTGHGSRTENNAYEAALDCGACGGQRGGPNARAASAILNRADVRARLAEGGIPIPDDTLFVPAEHDTATDQVAVLDAHLIPDSHRDEVARLQDDLVAAGAALADERAARLPGGDHPRRRARDWAQVRPEWGLARHAAFVVGPASTVRGLDLENRTFLHSYDWQLDPDARVLETILTAPGLVVQWINAQYYFSCVAPEVLGAGDKTLHNVVPDIGVLQGHGGDLQLGLPWQSVAVGDTLYHEPMRALYVVEAPLERIDLLIARNPLLQHYFDGQWLALVARANPEQDWQIRRPHGGWERWEPADSTPADATPVGVGER